MPEVMRDVVSGAAEACKAAECALLGGELAEMPDLYAGSDFDFAGTIVGVVERDQIVSGEDIVPGDVVLAFPSNGLHTNGYSLARRVFAEDSLETMVPALGGTLADALLAVHTSYLHPVQRLLSELDIKGMAHITGGGSLGQHSTSPAAGHPGVLAVGVMAGAADLPAHSGARGSGVR